MSDCELTDTYSPAAIDMAPAMEPRDAGHEHRAAQAPTVAATTPTIRLAVDTIALLNS